VVVRISQGTSIRGALSYNERKLAKGHAELLVAEGFFQEGSALGFSAKIKRFELLIEKNNNKSKVNTLHISLNFPPEETVAEGKMRQIARDYMQRIGFAGQPFLVYRHKDAHHPHFHIVTTNIRENGKAISLHKIATRLSNPARKAIEIEYGLIQAESRKKRASVLPTQLPLSPARYGKEETKHAITNILAVLLTYKFSDFDQYNALLRQVSVTADRGRPGSQMFNRGGLVYSLLDENGRKAGVAIKASSIYSSQGAPTLKNLEGRFQQNAGKKLVALPLASKILAEAVNRSKHGGQLKSHLAKVNIGFTVALDPTGRAVSATFIDHRRRAVFSNEELQLPIDIFSAKLNVKAPSQGIAALRQKYEDDSTSASEQQTGSFIPASTVSLMNALLNKGQDPGGGPDDIPKKKKKKRKGPSL
jgi:hypothetical protein